MRYEYNVALLIPVVSKISFIGIFLASYHKIVQKYKATVVSGTTHVEKNYRGQLIERQEYFWGDRLKDEDAGNANGMVKMEGKGGYFTFRIITEKNMMNGAKWWKKAVPANDVPMALIQNNEKQIADLIEKGVLNDLGLDYES